MALRQSENMPVDEMIIDGGGLCPDRECSDGRPALRVRPEPGFS